MQSSVKKIKTKFTRRGPAVALEEDKQQLETPNDPRRQLSFSPTPAELPEHSELSGEEELLRPAQRAEEVDVSNYYLFSIMAAGAALFLYRKVLTA